MTLARISDETLWTINGLEILGIIYLAVAVSRLRARIAYLEGRLNNKRSSEAHDDEK